ncbi:DUF2634 domain-containing protein [Paenibacillus sp. J22TS3]|uniref:DUF2634 domain-containing protein n=1 Tax=Paenibacillus sp. J22TS3 TaxID=2807192 RepID=UPI001B1CE1CF|nr:DUF2634 domain-containing protein [Paenibacillus sp. J22TS3]GIP20424.1 hypothetical protein J22TS3_06990 [Paenibacillus sp. J22TS3]
MPNLFPLESEFTENEAVEGAADDNVMFGRSWRFDYEAGEFIMTPTGKLAVADEQEAWIQWCMKVIRTPRYRYLVYSRDYGHELEDLIGSGVSRAVYESEIQRMIAEALMTDSRTERVDGFIFAWSGEACSFTCKVSSVRDEQVTLQGSVVV